jgi:hypothetical protein
VVGGGGGAGELAQPTSIYRIRVGPAHMYLVHIYKPGWAPPTGI